MSDAPQLQVAWDLRLPEDARKFRIAGELWGAYEHHHEKWGKSLIFESVRVARRVRIYPANWRALSDDELYALSWSS